jgi:hypothetical protein
MKVTCLSIFLLLATSALAFPNGFRSGDRRRRTRGAPGSSNNNNNNRALKGGMMGGMGMGSKGSKGANGCQSVKIKAPYDEIEAGISETAVGETLVFALYDYYTDKKIGSYTDQTTDTFVEGEFVDCTFTGSFNLDFDEDLEFPFVSQVMVAGTCFGYTNAITGGTGQYACASGYETFIDAGEDYFASELVICNTCAYYK